MILLLGQFINNRARYREKIDPGNFELTLAQLSGSMADSLVLNHQHTGSNVKVAGNGKYVQIIDDSSLTSGGSIAEGGLVYNLVSGSIDAGTVIYNETDPTHFGLLYPQHGIAILNGDQLDGIQARSSEQVKSTYYFVRIKNAEYNYSNNPSFVTGSLGQLFFSTMTNDPQVYVTTVGLYNNRKELLATAKLSQALLKNYTREALIKVKLDF